MDALSNVEVLERIVLSLVAGAILGMEREWRNRPAGLRTYALVCEGCALFMVSSILLSNEMARNGGTADPSRIGSTVVQGVGFIAGGVIFTHRAKVTGLTTAASIWVAAAIGLAIGAGYYAPAFIGVAAAMFTLVPMRWLEHSVIKANARDKQKTEQVSEESNQS
jgi:putative Mg2+ transporter-C (MgtC) family protein